MKASRLCEWLAELGYDPSFTEADARMLYRANYGPIWDHLMEHMRPARQCDLVRANLAANGVTVVGAGGGGEGEKAALEEERRQLQQRVTEATARVAQQEAEVRQLSRELVTAEAVLQQERSAAGEARARALIEEAMARVLEASSEVYEEYARRLAQETERLAYFAEDQGAEELDAELTARSVLLRRYADAARADEQTARQMMGEEKDETEEAGRAMDRTLYELQREHVALFVEAEELRQQCASLIPAPESPEQEIAELRAELEWWRGETERLAADKPRRLVQAQETREAQARVAALQREVRSVREEAEALLAQAPVQRAAAAAAGAEAAEAARAVLELEGVFPPLAERAKDGALRERAEFSARPLALLLRSTVSPQAAGKPHPLVRDLRVHADNPAPELESCGDLLLQRVFALAQAARDGRAVHPAAPSDTAALEARLDFLKEREEALIASAVLPPLNRAEAAAGEVMARRGATETALLEWRTLPAQLCIPDPEQRERFLRRYNYLRVLAHEAAKQGK